MGATTCKLLQIDAHQTNQTVGHFLRPFTQVLILFCACLPVDLHTCMTNEEAEYCELSVNVACNPQALNCLHKEARPIAVHSKSPSSEPYFCTICVRYIKLPISQFSWNFTRVFC